MSNTGTTYLSNIAVIDNLLGPICSISGILAPGASQTCTKTVTITSDTTNIGTARRWTSCSPRSGVDKTGSLTAVCPGQDPVVVVTGTSLTYCYRLTNTGDKSLCAIAVSDDLLGSICSAAGVSAR